MQRWMSALAVVTIALVVLKGSMFFASDLLRGMSRNLAVDEGITVDPEAVVVTVGCQEVAPARLVPTDTPAP